MCVSVIVNLQSCSLRSSSIQRRKISIQQQQQQTESICLARRRHRDKSRSGRLVWSLSGPATSAMAPALTQATPHQRCCPSNSTAPSLTLLPSKLHTSSLIKETEREEQQLVWSSPLCCGNSGLVKSVDSRVKKCNTHLSSSNHYHNHSNAKGQGSSAVGIGQEIARSEELTQRRGGGGGGGGGAGGGGGVADGQGNLDPPAAIVKALAATGPPPTGQGPDVDLAHTITSTGAVAPRSAPPTNGGGGGGGSLQKGGDEQTTLHLASLNGNADSTAMGLHPTAPGDRMDLQSPPSIVVQTPGKTPDWTNAPAPEVMEDEAVEDILDVIKSMEVDQCVGLAGLTVAEEQLLREAAAAVMNEAPLPVVNHPAASVVDKESEVERRLSEARSKQQQIEARCQTLLRRAGRLQSRHVGRHVADQVAHFVAYAKETLCVKGRPGYNGGPGSNLYGWAEDGRLPTREEVRNIPTATLVNLVSRLQAPPVSYLSNRRYFGLTSSRASSQTSCAGQATTPGTNGGPPPGGVVVGGTNSTSSSSHSHHPGRPINSQVADNLEEVAGLWEAQLRYLQRHDDPDATESSSGGESEDEGPSTGEPSQSADNTSFDASTHAGSLTSTPAGTLPTPTPKPVSTYQRAAWRWARDRAAVAARWSWLQAQVSDLEYRIRQHTDVYRQLRAAKGPIQFAPANGLTTPNVAAGTQTATPTTSPSKEASSELDESSISSESCSSSSRTRPMLHTSGGTGFRHRRLIRASQITSGSGRKSSRHSSTVRCCCVMSRIYHPCVLCNGKNNYLLPVDPDGMTLRERIGLTDRGFHPVLSLPQDIPLSAHVDSLLKSGDWRPPPPPAPSTPQRGSIHGRRTSSKPTLDDESVSVKRKQVTKRKKTVTTATGNDLSSVGGSEDGKLDRRKTLMKRRKRSALSTDATMDEDSGSSAFPSSPYESGSVPSTPGRPGNRSERSSVFQDLMRRRTSYDIDNIVIPYSMAATTRVERLQYKEIQTPKWRTVDEEELAVGLECLEDVEDVSEEACLARHDRSELEERRKFMSYLKQPAGVTRGRRRVDQIDRLDSRADHSSGANTPDPMSPSQVGSKVTDGAMMDMDIPAEEADRAGAEASTDGSYPASATKERRRTASLTKRDSSVWKFVHDDNSGTSWEMEEYHTVAPYEPRQFPLPDSVFDQLVEEMPPEEAEEELVAAHETRSTSKREARSSECGTGTSVPHGVPITLVSGATPTTTTSSVDDEAATFLSESTSSPGAEDLDVDDEDPNDPEWEGSQGSAPRIKKR